LISTKVSSQGEFFAVDA